MTNRPPDEPYDPRYSDPRHEHPETRRFDADEPTEAYGAGGAYQQDPYPYQQGYDPYGPQTGQYSAGPAPGGGPGGSGGSGRRTAALAAAVLAILLAIVVVLVLILRSGHDNGGTVAAPSTTTSTATESTTSSTTTTTTTTTEPTTTTDTEPPGSVTYQLTGSGDVVALRYRRGEAQFTVVAAAGAPWTQATSVSDGTAELSAIVIRGPVTCTILHGDKLLASSTSNGGPLACSAQLP